MILFVGAFWHGVEMLDQFRFLGNRGRQYLVEYEEQFVLDEFSVEHGYFFIELDLFRSSSITYHRARLLSSYRTRVFFQLDFCNRARIESNRA